MSLRVLHCPDNVGGNAQGLASAERKVGLDSRLVSFEPHRYGYDTDEVLFARVTRPTLRELKRWGLLWRALHDFDIIHFNFGQSILPAPPIPNSNPGGTRCLNEWFSHAYARVAGMADLPILKWAGKGIAVTYQGDDARQGDFCRKHFLISPADEVPQGYYSPLADAHKRHLIATMAKYAKRIYALNPDLLHVLPPRARFLPYGSVDLDDWRPSPGRVSAGDMPIVVHAPSHRGVKGTRFVQSAVSRLRHEGIRFEFQLAENLTRAEARRIYERADLAIDQLLCGWYGGFAVECMALEKPVIAYIREDDLVFIPDEMRAELPLIQANPQSIYQVLKEWLTEKRSALPALGRRSRAFVEKWHDPVKIAATLKRDYEAMAVGS